MATATATAAAARPPPMKPQLPALKTPISATYPSELRSPMVRTPTTYIKQEEEAFKTPITPPAAYLDFIKSLSPVLMSPMSAQKFTFGSDSNVSTRSNSTTSSNDSNSEKSSPTVAEAPKPESLKRTASESSTTTISSTSTSTSHVEESGEHKTETTERTETTEEHTTTTSENPQAVVPASQPNTASFPLPSPFVRPMSARTPRRLHIPQSPYSPRVQSPLSAHSISSPYSPAVGSAMSPADWDPEKAKFIQPASAGLTKSVHVRQVVTRTITYCKTPIDPAPKGKRRKVE